jgi:hypothetical protein
LIPLLGSVFGFGRHGVFALRRRLIRRVLDEEFAVTAPVEFVHHHLARAAGAYFNGTLDDAIVVTRDGGGDGDAAHVYDVRAGHFRRLGQAAIDDGAVALDDASCLAGYVGRLLGGNKPGDLVIAGVTADLPNLGPRLSTLPGIDRVSIQPDGMTSALAQGAALSACMLNRKQRRMARRPPTPPREPALAGA